MRRDGAQDFRELRIFENGADGLGAAIRIIIINARHFARAEGTIAGQKRVEARRNRKAVVGDFDGRLKHFGPRQLTVFLVHEFEQAHDARHAHRLAADDGLHAAHGLAVLGEEAVFLGSGGRHLAPVVARDLLGLGVPRAREGAAANA